MSVTVKDMVAPTGVPPSTVSRTCRDHLSISRWTKEEVRQAMVELGYEPNSQVSSLAIQNSRTVRIILPPSEQEAYRNPSYLEMMRGISQYCDQKQYINTVVTEQDEDKVLQAIKTMARAGLAEGFIMSYSKEQDPILDYLYEEGLLYVLIGKAYRNANQAIYVDNDSVLAGREATEYLLNLGHVRVVCLSGDYFLLYNHDRKVGYMLALTERGTPSDDQLCVEVPSVPGEQDQALGALFAREDRPTTVLVSDGILTVVLEKTCIGLGLSIPGDISTLSFNNSLFSRLTFPPLISVDVNVCQLGTETVAQMINHVESPRLVVAKITVPYHLVERESCVGAKWFRGNWGTKTI